MQCVYILTVQQCGSSYSVPAAAGVCFPKLLQLPCLLPGTDLKHIVCCASCCPVEERKAVDACAAPGLTALQVCRQDIYLMQCTTRE